LVAHAIVAAVICGFVNWAFLPSKSESTTPRAVAQARQTYMGILWVDHLGKRLAERRPPHGGDVVGHRSPHHDRAVTGQLDADLVSGFLETARGFYAGARMGLHYAITCNEFVDRIRPDEIEPATRGSYLGSWRVKNQMAACKDWPKTDLPADYFEPFRTDVPAVLISGDTDPAAPPRWGEEVKSFRPFPRARKACVSR